MKSFPKLLSESRSQPLTSEDCLGLFLPLMQQVADSRVAGHTGELWLDADNRVHRHQMWGVFEEGEPVIASGQDEQEEDDPEAREETDSVIN